ncbi:nitroreductase family protein [Enterococcus timonensis]|uniref:nitroreductase family protein n=1 Tax=Enterococcus timonensis TaxID=1852364 RepID=UPI0008D97294|nr:nitroreductase family protein [Enterococcus timonensis]
MIEQMMHHQTIRNFTGEIITDETKTKLVAAAKRAASSQNMQSFSIIGITDPEILQEIIGITKNYYLDKSGALFVFVADQHRNAFIVGQAEKNNQPALRTFDRFLAGAYDASLAAENLVLAAESLGYGTVILGSILNDAPKMIELLDLPELTFPLFAVAVGVPAVSEEHLKPRLGQDTMYFENQYVKPASYQASLAEYDATVLKYYQALGYSTPVTFSQTLAKIGVHSLETRKSLLKIIVQQGFLVDEK